MTIRFQSEIDSDTEAVTESAHNQKVTACYRLIVAPDPINKESVHELSTYKPKTNPLANNLGWLASLYPVENYVRRHMTATYFSNGPFNDRRCTQLKEKRATIRSKKRRNATVW